MTEWLAEFHHIDVVGPDWWPGWLNELYHEDVIEHTWSIVLHKYADEIKLDRSSETCNILVLDLPWAYAMHIINCMTHVKRTWNRKEIQEYRCTFGKRYAFGSNAAFAVFNVEKTHHVTPVSASSHRLPAPFTTGCNILLLDYKADNGLATSSVSQFRCYDLQMIPRTRCKNEVLLLYAIKYQIWWNILSGRGVSFYSLFKKSC